MSATTLAKLNVLIGPNPPRRVRKAARRLRDSMASAGYRVEEVREHAEIIAQWLDSLEAAGCAVDGRTPHQ